METIDHIRELFRKYMNGTAAPGEVQGLSALVEEYTHAELEEILEPLAISQAPDPAFRLTEWEPVIQAILQRTPEQQKGRVMGLRSWRRIAAAAAILIMLGVGSYFAFFEKEKADVATTRDIRFQNDIPPGGDKAILTLADGRQVVLDSASGQLASEGGVTVINLGGQLSYEEEREGERVLYHTVSTPRGGQYKLVLADGTKVWLNAASSLRFPTAFAGKGRVVELTGEGYFEVAHNKAKPFKVAVNGMEVQVLGTHFNINAYEDEGAVRTTLLEGSVKVSAPQRINASVILQPGQQALLASNQNEAFRIVRPADKEEAIAWKNGHFQFSGVGIESMMRQLQRWYNIEVEYEGEVPEREFVGRFSRSMSLSAVLKILEESNVRFRIEGRKIFVHQ